MVDILLSLLGSGSNLKFTFLHWLSVTVLLLRGDGELICELLAVFRVAGFTELLMDLKKESNYFTHQSRCGSKLTRTKTSIIYAKENDKEKRERRKERERKAEGDI